jgi:isocitrate/isopropylmalate dehydrogenase
VDNAVANCLEQRTILTADLGGTASTSQMGDEAARLIREG